MLLLARDIAMDIYDLDTVLKQYRLSAEEWEGLKLNQRFQQLLESEAVAWSSADNAHERVKRKSATLIEVWLEEAARNVHDHTQPLDKRAKVAELVARLAGMGQRDAAEANAGERFSVVINLGADKTITFDQPLPPKVIEGEAEDISA